MKKGRILLQDSIKWHNDVAESRVIYTQSGRICYQTLEDDGVGGSRWEDREWRINDLVFGIVSGYDHDPLIHKADSISAKNPPETEGETCAYVVADADRLDAYRIGIRSVRYPARVTWTSKCVRVQKRPPASYQIFDDEWLTLWCSWDNFSRYKSNDETIEALLWWLCGLRGVKLPLKEEK